MYILTFMIISVRITSNSIISSSVTDLISKTLSLKNFNIKEMLRDTTFRQAIIESFKEK